MNIWVDMSAPAHVLVLRPIIERLREQGHTVEVTSRDYAQTQALLDLHGMEHTPIGSHGGASRLRKAYQLGARTTAMIRFGRSRSLDLALAHGSNDLAIAARALGVPECNMHDYEYAVTQHRIGCRLAKRVMFPDSVPPERLRRFGVGPEKLFPYPGLKEEYYLYDFEPDPEALEKLSVDTAKVVVVVRPPPDVSLYHRKSNPLFPKVLSRLGHDPDVQAVVLPRTAAQRGFHREPAAAVADRAAIRGRGAEPGRARRPRRLRRRHDEPRGGGARNARLHDLRRAPGRRRRSADPLRAGCGRSTDPRAIQLEKRTAEAIPTKRDPSLLVETILGTVGASHPAETHTTQ